MRDIDTVDLELCFKLVVIDGEKRKKKKVENKKCGSLKSALFDPPSWFWA